MINVGIGILFQHFLVNMAFKLGGGNVKLFCILFWYSDILVLVYKCGHEEFNTVQYK